MFELGVNKLKKNDSPQFIAATKEYCTYEKHISAPYLRKSFILKNKPEDANIIVSGLGFYRLFINGKEITKGYLAPYISNTDHLVYFDKYDVAEYLTEGENVIGAILGNGMQNALGGFVWDFHLADFRSAPKLALRLTADEKILETDETWKCAESPIFFDDLRSGCFYDARKEIDGWNETGFDDALWQNAFFAETPKGEYRFCEAEPIKVCSEKKPVKFYKNTLKYIKSRSDDRRDEKTGELITKSVAYQTFTENTDGYLYDFGVNSSGVFRLKIKGKKGQRVIIQAIEHLDENGETQFENIGLFYPTGYSQRDIYILKGEGEEEFIPSFTYHGCRYYHISGITEEQATEELLTYLEMHSDFADIGGFNCSDSMMNRLQEMCVRSAKSNFYYFPTDCPHREKNGWTGDASYSAEYMLQNFDAGKSLLEWERNIVKALDENGALPGIVPTAGWGYHWGNGPAWDRVIAYLPYYTYIYSGNKKILEESAVGIFTYLKYLTTRKTEKNLFDFGLGDWAPPGVKNEDSPAPVYLTSSIMVMSICEKSAYIFAELGMENERRFAENMYSKTKQAIRENCINFKTFVADGSCQTSQSMCIFYNVFEENEKPNAFKKLLQFIEEKNGHFDSGYLGNRVIFHILSEFGKTELALNMILRPDWPSYAYPVIKYNATTIWESYHKTQQNSLNHHFYGDISNFFIKRIAGLNINPNKNNVNEFLVKPYFAEKLTFAESFYIMNCGKVSVRWERNDIGISIKIDAPKNSTGTLLLPDGYVFSETTTNSVKVEDGKSVFNAVKNTN